MITRTEFALDSLDAKANSVFGGKVVRKDLVRKVKVGANVPVYVLEYLLGTYCATDDPAAIEVGLRVVNDTLAENYVRPDEAAKAQSRVRERGEHTFIDKVKVRLVASEDKYWAELANFGEKYVHIPEHFVSKYERLLEGGVWAQIGMRYDYDETQTGRKSPFYIKDLRPIQLATFDLDEYRAGRAQFTTDEWLDLLIRSIGLEPVHFDRRLKLLFLARLIPMTERNYNFIELGPRGTGKSFVYREVSPYSILISGGRTTVANLFFNMASGKLGLVGLWDVVAFDEVAGIQFDDRTAVQILKDYMESGSFSRGREEIVADASMVFVGNINQPVEVLVKSSHLFQPLPDAMQDMALIDRFHFYLPGWETPKMASEHFTNRYGFVVDYLAEALRDLRRHNLTEAIDRHFSLGSHLNARDAKAVRKTVAGYLKLLHPDGEQTKQELQEYLEIALESRRRIKEQLKKMGAFEYFQTSFSYTDHETMEERFVGVPEQGGRDLIATDPLAPGSVYTASVDGEGHVGLFRLEVGTSAGTGRLRAAGGLDRTMKESLDRAFAYLQSHKVELGIGREVDTTDVHVQAIDLLNSRVPAEAGTAFFIALVSALRNRPVLPALMILGDMTIQGNLKGMRSLVEALQLGMDNGAKRALIPTENRRHFFDVSADVIEQVDPIFYSDPQTAAHKALGIS